MHTTMIARTGRLVCGLVWGLLAAVALHGAPPAGWVLTFSDEFEGPRVDHTKWFTRYLGFREPPDRGEAKHRFDLERGHLILEADEGGLPSSIQTAQGDYHQARYRYDHYEPHHIRFDQCYGWFEIRARLRAGTGAVTFWLNKSDPDYYHDRALRAGGAAYGPVLRNRTSREIDIIESYKRSKYNFHILSSGTPEGDVKTRGDFGFDFSQEQRTRRPG